MSIRCGWSNEVENILVVHFSKKWTQEEFRDANRQVEHYAGQVSERFDIITDFSAGVIMLPIGSLETWLTLAEQRDREFPNWGLTVWVMEDAILEAYFDTGHELSEVIRKHVLCAKTIKEATNLILEHRKTQTPYSV